jgi:hypothetical protein
MKNVVIQSTLGLLLLSSVLLNAQTKPNLTEINFLVSGVPVNATGNGDVTVELKFDRTMNTEIDPIVTFGLEEPFELNVPKKGNGWISNTLWQGFFTVSANNPETDDGEYVFQISDAVELGGAEMDTTLSTELEETLFICRAGKVDLSSASLNFGSITAGEGETRNLTIFNQSCAPLTVTGVVFSPSSNFALTNTPPAFTIPGNGSRNLTILFSTNNRGNVSGSMTIFSNDPDQSTHVVSLTGSARGPKIEVTNPGIPISLGEINFGKWDVGTLQTRVIAITNISDGANPSLSDTLRVSSISTNNEVYGATPTTLVIPPDSTELVDVKFAPTSPLLYNGRILSISSNDLTQPIRTIVLNGDARDELPPPQLNDISINLPNYNGYISGNFLPICWSNPSDPTGIAAIWWYFSNVPLDPLTAPKPDTTQKTSGGRVVSIGGRIQLGLNGTCASLRLFGTIGAGLWYGYIWAEDGSGNQEWRSASGGEFVYDINPPLKPKILSSFPIDRWFGSGNYNLTIEILPDPSHGRKDAARVFWKYKAAPTASSDFSGQFTLPSGSGNKTLNVPFNSESLCGDDSLYVWLEDSVGNVDHRNYTALRYRFDICDPVIERTRPDTVNIARLGQAFTDTLLITDAGVGVDTAWVLYRFGGADAAEPPRKVTRIPDTDKFVMDIPPAGVTRRGIEYRVIAQDSLDNTGTGPTTSTYCGELDDDFEEEEFWFPVRTRIEGNGLFRIDGDGKPVPLIAGEDSTNYQLFSVPYDLDTSGVLNVLEDDLGDYDDTQWRLFDYKTDNPEATRFREGANARPFVPGRSFFLITRKENIVVDSGPGRTRRTICDDSIRVYEGWNLIATPFDFPVHRDEMRLSFDDHESSVSLRSYERGWNIINVMEPWKGYALYVTRPVGLPASTLMYLIITPKADIGRLEKIASDDHFALQPGEWLVQVSASAGQSLDLENWAGVREGAAENFDRYELAEPPVIGRFLRVQFAKPEWNQPARGFSTDIRPVSREQAWDFEVETNQPETLVRLDFSFLGDFPASAEVFVVDESAKIAQNLRGNAVYSFKSGRDGSNKKMKLIVGSAQFASAAAGEIELVPQRFELLQNYPNPFNPETSLRYNLPAAGDVRLEVFDVLGRKVRTLVNGEHKNAGYHHTLWNGRDDNGRQVASGVYIYRVVSGQQSLSRKMILMK